MASSSVPSSVGNLLVVTHVVPSTPSAPEQPLSQRSLAFRKGQPKALGVVQIMIGLVMLTFGITAVFYHVSFGVVSGIFAWGSLIFISAGSVAVAAETQLSPCLIYASLVLNIIASIVSGIGMILHTLDAVVWNGTNDYDQYHYSGFSIVLALFQALEFFVSIISAGLTCKATCKCCGAEPQVLIQTVEGVLAAQAPPHSHTAHVVLPSAPTQATFYCKIPEPGSDSPPAYQPQS